MNEARPFFELTFTLGNVLTIAAMVIGGVIAWNAFKTWMSVKIARFEATLSTHAEALSDHAVRLSRYEAQMLDLVGKMQNLMGRFEIVMHDRGLERRAAPRE